MLVCWMRGRMGGGERSRFEEGQSADELIYVSLIEI